MNSTERNPAIVWLLAVMTVVLVVVAGLNVQNMRQAAADSAHGALWNEIKHQLEAREVTGDFPLHLSELPLTYPDGGDAELLKKFTYVRTESGYEASTTLRGHRLEARFPSDSPP